jgi:hydrogenase-4 membrane subunit HyfE
MTTLLIGFILVLLVPLFVATWRMSLLGLSLQGCLLTAMAWRLEGGEWSIDAVATFVDLFVVRGVVAPWLLYGVLHARKAPDRNDVLPANLLAWAAAVGLVLLALRLAAVLVPIDGDQQMMVGAVVSGVLLGFLVLATQVGAFSQIIGAIRVENAVALFELSGGPHEGGVAIHVGQTAILLASILMFRWYLLRIAPAQPVRTDPAPDDLEEIVS